MTNMELLALAQPIAVSLETSITRAWDGATFTYKPEVALVTENVNTHLPTCTRVVVRVPVNAVLDRAAALAMINAFRKALVAAAGETRITCKTVKAKGGGRTSIHTSGYTHMGVFHVDGYWASFSVEALGA